MFAVRPGHRLLPAPLVLALLLTACVSSARHQQVLDESARLLRENTDLRQRLAEERVRREEALEAMRRVPASGAPPSAPSIQEPELSPSTGAGGGLPAPPGGAPDSAEPASPAAAGQFTEEDLRGSPGVDLDRAADDDGILRVARHYRDRGQARQALDAYTRLIKEYPFSPLLPGAFLERGLVREREGDREGALSDFLTVAEAFPDSSEASQARQRVARLRN